MLESSIPFIAVSGPLAAGHSRTKFKLKSGPAKSLAHAFVRLRGLQVAGKVGLIVKRPGENR
jgi:hypothetical protein